MSTPYRIRPLLAEAYNRLSDAQSHANAFDRPGLGKDIDNIRWALGDLLTQLEMETE